MAVIDADAHVIETERTWDYLDASQKSFRPLLLRGTAASGAERQFWYIDGKIKRSSEASGPTTPGQVHKEKLSGRDRTTAASRQLDDVGARLAHMDELGIDIQVLYPTIYLTPIASSPDAEAALAWSYNRWLADAWRQSGNRLRWVMVPALQDMDATLEQLRFAKENGGCGVFMRGIEGRRLLFDPYFFPLYEEAQRLDMPICIHAGVGNNDFAAFFTPGPFSEPFSVNKLGGLSAFNSLVFHEIPAMFPKLRFGFLEYQAQWVPYLVLDMQRRLEREGKSIPANLIEDNHIYVTCETHDDLPYILGYSGEGSIILGTDYGHAGNTAELEALSVLRNRMDLSESVKDRILDDNPRAFYGL